ncbi:36423_t:CDS:1, partial [Gigaspora margarita]
IYQNACSFKKQKKRKFTTPQWPYYSNYEKANGSYMVEEKCKTIELVRRTSNKFATKTYFLDLTMLGQWVKNFSQDNFSNKNLQRVGSERYVLFLEEKAQLYE